MLSKKWVLNLEQVFGVSLINHDFETQGTHHHGFENPILNVVLRLSFSMACLKSHFHNYKCKKSLFWKKINVLGIPNLVYVNSTWSMSTLPQSGTHSVKQLTCFRTGSSFVSQQLILGVCFIHFKVIANSKYWILFTHFLSC